MNPKVSVTRLRGCVGGKAKKWLSTVPCGCNTMPAAAGDAGRHRRGTDLSPRSPGGREGDLRLRNREVKPKPGVRAGQCGAAEKTLREEARDMQGNELRTNRSSVF